MIKVRSPFCESMRIIPAEQEVIISVVIIPASIIATHTALIIEQTNDLKRDDGYIISLKHLRSSSKSDYKKKNITGTIIAYPSDSRTWITTFISDRG